MRLIFILIMGFLLVPDLKAQPAYCQLSGAVFVEKDAAKVQYRVFLEPSESFADMLVYQASNALFADKPGNWFFTDARAQANIFIIFVNERSKADFSIHYTETESFAGCQSLR